MTAGSPAEHQAGLRIGVVLEAFLDWPLERVLLRALAGSDRVAVTAVAEMSAAAREAVAAPGVTLHASVAEMLDAATIDGADLLKDWPDAPWTPGFREGAAVQAVCDAMEASADSGRWVMINEVTSGGNL